MTKEQLEKGRALVDRIDVLKRKIQKWEMAKELVGVEFRYPENPDSAYGRSENYAERDTTLFNFEEIKAITLVRLKKRLSDLELEFSRL